MVLGTIAVHAAPPGGLKFHGSELPIDQRTSYNVFGDQSVRFTDNFDIEFNLSLYPTTEFGYILRIKNRQSNSIYHLFYDGQGGNHTFKLNEEGRNNLIVANISRDDFPSMNFLPMKVSFNLKGDEITLTIGDQVFQTNKELPDTYEPIILFGRSDHFIDVPSFAIKDLSVIGHDRYVFELQETNGNVVHDINGRSFGKLSNPEWLINDAYHWRFKTSFKSRSVAGANYDAKKKVTYYFNQDSLFVYDVRSGRTEIKVFEQPNPVKLVLGTNFIDTENDKLYSYETYYAPPNDNYTGPTVASLDLNTFKWTPENSAQLTSPLHHHGNYFDASNHRYTIFGGFGRMYYSKAFESFDLATKQWTTLDDFGGDFLSPRYFSSVGYFKKTNSIYVFGGMGNESGEQTVGRKYYYDLYKIDLNTKQVSKLWDIPWDQDNMVPVRNMVILDDSTFYTLCYPEHISQSRLKLYRFSMKDGKYETLGDSIPIRSDKITTNANLYYDSALNNLYTVVQEFDDDISSKLKVYSLSFPPITRAELEAYSKVGGDKTLVYVLISLLLASAIGFLIYRKTRPKTEDDIEGIPTEHIPDKPVPVSRRNAIFLFGDFTVHDRNNKNITYMFSGQLKQIFCLILQYSTTEGGIASARLSAILWPDRPADKVKNSRGVTINHLRKVLSELDGIELTHDKGYFKIEQKDPFYCDYTRCMEIIAANEEEKYRDELVDILRRGKFLQLSDHPLYDSFKEEMEKKLEPVLLIEMEKSYTAELYETAIAFAEAVSNIDPLNEIALNYHLKALQKLKMNDEAKVRYQAFVIEYRKAMGNDYPHAYPTNK